MLKMINYSFHRIKAGLLFCLVWVTGHPLLQANPTGGVVTQGAATFSTSGSTFTVNQSSANAYINWNSFNIGAGETTTFVQPSATSVTWNHINDADPSQILGNINANGYVILQNENGFAVGGSAVINAHGLIMTTSATPAPNLDSGGAWDFSAPPPTAKIVNYGQINLTGGGFGYLIASDIENNGTITAPGGKIGLYAGEKVLVSSSPDGRGLSAEVTLPQGSVDNEGKLIADGGSIAAQAQTVNQNGLVQADSIQNVNGVIELVASGAVNLGANSTISAQGGSSGVSAGGSVTIKSDNIFSDQSGSAINIGGGAQGGNGGQVEISAPEMNSIFSTINGQAATGYVNGQMTIDPLNIVLAATSSDPNAQYTGTVNPNDPPTSGTLTLNVNDFASTLSQINLQAQNDITLSTVWSLTDPGVSATLSLVAGNSIIFNNGSGINAGKEWNVNLTAGPASLSSAPAAGTDGVYLNGTSYIQTQDGDINITAANEVQIATGSSTLVGNNGIRTLGGGNINVTTLDGDVNTGGNVQGYNYIRTAPYYTVSPTLGGISTANGGNVDITAGGNVISYLPSGSQAAGDAGTGAFGSAPGNVTIKAGGSVYGHYVVADGTGEITAQGDVGGSSGSQAFALSLINGSWDVTSQNGSIYLQEVRNPNGVFNNIAGVGNNNQAGKHLFNYGADDSVSLNAQSGGVYLTDLNLPRPSGSVQVIYPSILNIAAGSGGVTLEGDVTLFPSPDQNLEIVTTDGGNWVGTVNGSGTSPELLMSDSSQTRWTSALTFSDQDHGSLSAEPTAATPVNIDIAGNMEDLTLITTKATTINVGGDMLNCGFSGQNLSASDKTIINVGGQIYNQSAYAFINGINISAVPASDIPPGLTASWDDVFALALNPTLLPSPSSLANVIQAQWVANIIQSAGLFGQAYRDGQWVYTDQGFVFNLATGRLGFGGPMPQDILSYLTQPITVLHLQNGLPVVDPKTGQFETDTINWVPTSQLQALFTASQADPPPSSGQLGYRIGGPGEFDITAGSISLGNTYGILSCDVSDPQGGFDRYGNLVSISPSGAEVNVTVTGDLTMETSTIASLGGGDVNVFAGGAMDLGSQELFNATRQVGFGVYTAGPGDVNVTAGGDLNIDGSRIASYDGGNIYVESKTGNVNAGSGGATQTGVYFVYVDPVTGLASFYPEFVFGSGIVANTLVPASAVSGYPPAGVPVAAQPGNITVTTPQGDIIANLGGILQEALNGNTAAGPVINLSAGTPPTGKPGDPDYSPGYPGSIDLGESGVIGGTVNATANGDINGLIISRQDSNVQAAQNFSGTVLAGGQASLSAGGSASGVVVGVSGVSASTGGSLTASLLGQSVSGNGVSQNTLGGSATATAASTSASATTSSENTQQTSSTTDSSDEDDKKKKKKLPVLEKIKRVTVLLSASDSH